jgi:hypothetical protein
MRFLNFDEAVLPKVAGRGDGKAGATNGYHTGRNRNTPQDLGETPPPSGGGKFDRNDTTSISRACRPVAQYSGWVRFRR